MGFVLTADPADFTCDTKSPWDAGGEGDFFAILDRNKEYFYFFFSSYVKNFQEQGVGVARLRYADRENPAGKALKWRNDQFSEPGVGGHFTPDPPRQGRLAWRQRGYFLGTGHSLEYLPEYLRHAAQPRFGFQNDPGGYIHQLQSDLANPKGWSEPQKILDRDGIMKAIRGFREDQSNGWYPQVIGTARGESDKLCERSARFFMNGLSRLEIVFLKPGKKGE